MKKSSARTISSIFSILIAIVSIISFCATTVPRRAVWTDINVNRTFLSPKSKAEVFSQLKEGHSFNTSLSENLADTLFYVYFDIPDYSANVTAVASIKSLGRDTTIIQLRNITEYSVEGPFGVGVNKRNVDACAALTPMDFTKYFKENYVDVLLYKQVKWPVLYFGNKRRLDESRGVD